MQKGAPGPYQLTALPRLAAVPLITSHWHSPATWKAPERGFRAMTGRPDKHNKGRKGGQAAPKHPSRDNLQPGEALTLPYGGIEIDGAWYPQGWQKLVLSYTEGLWGFTVLRGGLSRVCRAAVPPPQAACWRAAGRSCATGLPSAPSPACLSRWRAFVLDARIQGSGPSTSPGCS